MTRQSFWAQKMSKTSTPGPSYGGLKKGMAKSVKMPWWLPSLNSCHMHKLGRNCKIAEEVWHLSQKSVFFIEGFPYGQSKFGDKSGEFCPIFTPIRHFFWLSLFSLPLCIFLVISFQTPLWKSKTPVCGQVRLGLVSFDGHSPTSWIFSGGLQISLRSIEAYLIQWFEWSNLEWRAPTKPPTGILVKYQTWFMTIGIF